MSKTKTLLTESQKKKLEKMKNAYEFKKEKKQIKKDEKNDIIKSKFDDIDNDKKIIDQQTKFINSQNENLIMKRQSVLTKNIPTQFAKTLKGYNNLFIFISAISSLIGLTIMVEHITVKEVINNWVHFKNLEYLFFGFIFFELMKVSNFFNTQLFVIKDKFFDNWIYLIYIYIVLITVVSIASNFQTWYNVTHSSFLSFIFACSFDIIALCCSAYYNKYFYNIQTVTTEKERSVSNKERSKTTNKCDIDSIDKLKQKLATMSKGVITSTTVGMNNSKTNFKNWMNDIALENKTIKKVKNKFMKV